MQRFEISGETLDIPALAASMENHAAGGFASFEGRVRDHNDGRQVDGLDYEVFEPLALSEGAAILEEARQKFGVTGLRAVHRQGRLAIGDCAVWVGATAPHRDEAFRACRYVIDAVKHRLPVWKKEHYTDGAAEWVNCQHPAAPEHEHAHHHHHPAPEMSEAAFYVRQLRLPEVGPEGQAKLKAARVLIVGAGGLGSPAALMLAAAGVGRIGIAEFDRLEVSNLHRQVLYDAAGVGGKKAALAAARLKALNPFIEVEIHDARVDAARVPGLFAGYDVVLDCTDNFPTKYLLGDAAVLFGVPVVQASIHRFEGQMLTIDRKSEGGCLRCLWREPPPEGAVGNCAEVGVLGVVPGLFGTMQAAEALKLILGLPGTLDRHLLIMDALSFETRRIARRRDAECPLCGDHPSITALPQATNGAVELDAAELTSEALAAFRIVDLREPEERAEAPLPDTIMACAVQLPFSRFDAAALPFDDSRKVLFVCSRGGRSLKAATELRARGWREVYSLVGGASRLTPLLLQAAE